MIGRIGTIAMTIGAVSCSIAAQALPDDPEPRVGLALHGEPAQGTGYTHFPHVNPDAPEGGTFRQAVVGTFDTLNPFIPGGRKARGAASIYDPLMKRVWDEPFSLYCYVCETVSLDESGMTLALRPEARWHDGTALTAADVVFTFEIQREEGSPSRRRVYGQVTSIEAVDDHTVRYTFGEGGSTELPLLLGLMQVLPAHAWTPEPTIEPPLGSGAYRIAALDPGRSISYERVPDYWAADLPAARGYNNFDQVRYDYYRDRSVGFEAFLAGEADVWRENFLGDGPQRWQTAYDVPQVQRGEIVKASFGHSRPAVMRGFFFNTRRAPLDNVQVRQAMGLAFDFDRLNQTLYGGFQERTRSWFHGSSLAATGAISAGEVALLEQLDLADQVDALATMPALGDGDDAGAVRRALRQASALLDAADFPVEGGVRVDRDGNPLRFELMLRSASDEPLALAWQRGLERLGIGLDLVSVDSSVYGERLQRFAYDITVQAVLSSLSPGTEQRVRYHGIDAASTEGSRNYAGLADPAVEAVLTALEQATDRDQLETASRLLDRMLMHRWLVVPWGAVRQDYIAHRSSLAYPDRPALYGTVLESWWYR